MVIRVIIIFLLHWKIKKTTFTCPYRSFTFMRMQFGLCHAPATFQRCIMLIFSDMVEDTIEMFMDDFSMVGDFFERCLSHLSEVSKRSASW